MRLIGLRIFGGRMLQKVPEEVHHKARSDPALPRISAIGLAFAVGIAYFLAAQLSLALLAEPDGVAVFWPAAGVSSGLLVALGRDARLRQRPNSLLLHLLVWWREQGVPRHQFCRLANGIPAILQAPTG